MEHGHSHDHVNSHEFHDHSDEEEEADVMATVLTAFADYEVLALLEHSIVEQHWNDLDVKFQKMIPSYSVSLKSMKSCIFQNYNFILDVLYPHFATNDEIKKMSKSVEGGRKVLVDTPPDKIYQTKPFDFDKVQSTIKQFVREWSLEGAEERNASYGPIFQGLSKYLPNPKGKKVLSPGAGLGRLCWDISMLGYSSQGNEYSFFMLIPANFMLNRMTKKFHYQIYPFINQRSNHMYRNDQLRSVKIPDVDPSALPDDADFSMVAGDFLDVYSAQPGEWDCVTTSFFIDTAKNVFEYIETIAIALKDGGFWINNGPLLYHWAEMPGEFSIELAYDELRNAIVESGFDILEELVSLSTYSTNSKSMLQVSYKCVYFVAQKTRSVEGKVKLKGGPLKPMWEEKDGKGQQTVKVSIKENEVSEKK